MVWNNLATRLEKTRHIMVENHWFRQSTLTQSERFFGKLLTQKVTLSLQSPKAKNKTLSDN
jgi:hypothetical protein